MRVTSKFQYFRMVQAKWSRRNKMVVLFHTHSVNIRFYTVNNPKEPFFQFSKGLFEKDMSV